jgi:anthranilate phosphoribosyltransferase
MITQAEPCTIVPRLRRLIAGEALSENESGEFIGELMDGSYSPVQGAALLTALAAKGESPQEVVGAARAMRERSLHVEHDLPLVLDIVGTGGDGANTINISTLAALVVAGAGIPVAKHGNRAASSTCGSADVLEAAGLCVDIAPEVAARMLRETNFTFMFAPRYHPAMKHVAPVRRELGVRTVFNVLGPLTNPARATHQVVGVAHEEHLELMADALRALGVRAGAVVHASDGIDEVAGEETTTVIAFDEVRRTRRTLRSHEYGIAASLDALHAGSVQEACDAFERILDGERSPRAEVVALNAALGLFVVGAAPTITEGLDIARMVLGQRRARAVFERAKAIAA